MSRIYCTKKFQDFVGNVEKELPKDLNEISLSDWNAHLFYLDKRKCIVFVNNLTFYAVFLTGILKKDLKIIDELFFQRLHEQFIYDKIPDIKTSIDFVFPENRIKFFRTNNNRKVIGRINDYVNVFKYNCFYRYENVNQMDLNYENGLINETPTGKFDEIKKGWNNPIDNIKKIIKTSA